MPDRDKSYYGQDRLHLVEAELYAIKRNTTFPNLQNLERLWPRCLRTPAENRYRQLRVRVFFHSFRFARGADGCVSTWGWIVLV